MKHKFLASLLALSMLLGLLPGAALAAEDDGNGEAPIVCAGYEADETCAAETHVEGCPLYVAPDPDEDPSEPDETPVEGEGDPTATDPEQEEPVVEETTAAKQLQARIDVLPDAEELEEMDEGKQAQVYAEVDAIADAIDELTAEEADALDTAKLEKAAAFFTRQIMTLDEGNSDATMSGYCGGDDTSTPFQYTYTNSSGNTQSKTVYSNVTWAISIDGSDKYTLTLSGSGAMANWEYVSGAIRTAVVNSPWSAYSAKITKVEMDDGIVLGNRAFQGLSALESFILPSGITKIPEYAFADCVKLQNMVIPSTVTEIGLAAFRACDGMTEITFPASVVTWGNSVLRGCSGMESVNLPSNMETIPDGFFAECVKLKEIEVPASVTNIESGAFSGCTSLEYVNMSNTKISSFYNMFSNCTALRRVSLPETVTSIGEMAFAGLAFKSIILPSQVNSIAGTAFGTSSTVSNDLVAVVMNTAPFDYYETNYSGSGGEYWQRIGSGIFKYIGESSTIYLVGDKVPLAFTKSYANNRIDSSKTSLAVTNGGNFAEDTKFASATLATPTKEGYSFGGWYSDSGFTGTAVTAPTAGQTYYAKWTESIYTVDNKLEFDTLTYGKEPAGQEISATIKDGETEVSGSLSASIDSENFTVSPKNGKITVTPANNLNAGSYTATVTVTTPDRATHNVTVSLTVKKATLPAPELSGYTATATSITVTEPTLPTGASEVQYSIDEGKNWQKSNVFSDLKAGTSYSVIAKFVADDSGNYADSANSELLGVQTSAAPSTTPNTPGNTGGSHSSSSSSSSSSTYPVTVDSTKNGTVSVSPKNAKKDATVTLTVKANSGYELDDLTVTDKNGKNIKVTEGKNGKFTFTMPAGKVTVEASFTKIEEQTKASFTDVPANAYYADAVAWAVENGVTSGTSADTFSPNAACTRAQAVTFLWRAAGSPAPKSSVNPFADVPASAYYYDAVLWAVEQGITSGTSADTFSPNATCTRGQIVTFLYRADGTAAAGSNPFTDVADSAYYYDAVLWAVAEGVTSGTSATTFSPDASCTRAQIVTFLYRAYAD